MKTKFNLLLALSVVGIAALSSCTKTPGKVSFWVQNDLGGGGNITVNISGQGTKTITGYYSGGVSECSATSAATYSLPPATYNYTAANTDSSLTWSGSCAVTESGCLTVKLTN